MVLSEEQVEHFYREGDVVAPGHVPLESIWAVLEVGQAIAFPGAAFRKKFAPKVHELWWYKAIGVWVVGCSC